MVVARTKPRIGAVTIYLIAAGAYGLYSRMIFTVVAVYYLTVVRVNPLQLVLIGTALEATEFLCEVPTGLVADTYSRRFAVIAATFLFGCSYVLQGLMPLFAAIVALEIIRGIGNACISGALAAWIAQEVGEGGVERVFARAAQVRQAGGLVGIALSLGLASIRLALPIVIGGGLSVVLSLFLLMFMPEHRGDRDPLPGSRPLHAMRHTLRDAIRCVRDRPGMAVLLAVAGCYGASGEGIDRLWEAHLLAGFTFPPLGVLRPVVWFGIIEAASMLLSILALEVNRRRITVREHGTTARTLGIITAVQVVSLVAFGLSPTFALAVTAFWGYAIARSIAGPLYRTWLVQHSSQEVRATGLSIVGQVDALGQIVGGPLIGALATAASLRAALIGVAGLLLPALPLCRRAGRLERATLTTVAGLLGQSGDAQPPDTLRGRFPNG